MLSDSETDQKPTPSKRKNYDLKFKLDAVEYAESHNNSKAARQFNVGRSCIKDWIKQKVKLQEQM